MLNVTGSNHKVYRQEFGTWIVLPSYFLTSNMLFDISGSFVPYAENEGNPDVFCWEEWQRKCTNNLYVLFKACQWF